jgi:hypothetical protein
MFTHGDAMLRQRVLEGVPCGVVGLGFGADDADEGGEENEEIEGAGEESVQVPRAEDFGGEGGVPGWEG